MPAVPDAASGELIALDQRSICGRGQVTPVSLDLPQDLSESEWTEIGSRLNGIERSVSWWIGDWWAFGEHRYGERKRLVESENWNGPAFQTCVNASNVCKRFATNRRRLVLSFTHHAEVAGRADADELLDLAERGELNTRALRAEVSRRNAALAIDAPNADESTCTVTDLERLIDLGHRFGTIYADPPWLYDNQGTRAATGNHYRGLTVDQLAALPIGSLAAESAHLHLWTTNAFLFECPKLFAAWGFEFRTTFVWVKNQMGIGNYWRNSHEIMLTAIRGDAKRFNDHSMMSWLEGGGAIKSDRGRHSSKPEQVRHLIERASPGPRLELFARSPATGWTVWGNQIERGLLYPDLAEVA